MKRIKNLYSILYILILLYVFSTVTQSLYPFSLNRIWTIGIIVCLLARLIKPLKRSTFIFFLLLGIGTLISTKAASNLGKHINDLIYFCTGILWILFMSHERNRAGVYKAFLANQRITGIILIASYASIILPFFVSSGYSLEWGKYYYVGFAGVQHTLASSVCTVSAVFLLYLSRRRFNWIYLFVLLISVYAVFESGARTFIIPIGILVYYYIRSNVKNITNKVVVYSVGCMAGVYILLNSSILDKFAFVVSGANMSSNVLEGFTSGRSLFWSVDLNAFIKGNILEILFGRGFDYVYALNLREVQQEIWAHNDFIHLLVGGGINFTLLYIGAILFFFKRNIAQKKTIDKWLIMVYLLFPALINGFFMYQHLLISLMVLIIADYSIKSIGSNEG